MEKTPFDEIWIVPDNDERNSYHLNAISLSRIRKILNRQYFSILKAFEGEYFLSAYSFEEFLVDLYAPPIPIIKDIITFTEKANLFSEYKDNSPKALFYKGDVFSYGQKRILEKRPNEIDFDENWKNYIQKAYSCRAFEIWLILHFQRSETSFSDSASTISHIQLFAPLFNKGKGNRRKQVANAYDALKPEPFAENYETMDKAQAAIDKMETAIENGNWLQQRKLKKGLRTGLEYYELDPYTDVHYLLSSLLGKEEKITWGILGQQIDGWNGMHICFSFDTTNRELSVFIENISNPQVLINDTNKENYIWIQGIKNHRRATPIYPTNLDSLIYLLPGENTNPNKIFQFHAFEIEETSYFLHFKWELEKLIFPIQI